MPLKKGFEGKRRPKERVNLQIVLVFTFTRLKTCTYAHLHVFDKYLHWSCVSANVKYIYIHNYMISVNVNDLPKIYTPYIQLLTLIRTTLITTTWY